jgi:3-hydroxybutyryl-CoA dehydrogenase
MSLLTFAAFAPLAGGEAVAAIFKRIQEKTMIKQIGILGAGQMGSGIAQIFAQQGLEVVLFDIAEAQLTKSLKGIERNLSRQVEKGQLDTTAVAGILKRICTTDQMTELAECDLAIEAVTERESIKCEIFKQLDTLLKPEAILASNTSSIPITRIAAVTKRPEQVIGMHFMNPVPVMKLVEVIRGIATSEETFANIAALVEKIGKEMAVSADYPGFIVNRILIPMINEAAFALYEGVASAEDIDKGMRLGTNQPMGPLTLADFIGLDTCLAIMEVLYNGFKDSKYRPCPLLVKMVGAGYLGRKSGRGFYTYN